MSYSIVVGVICLVVGLGLIIFNKIISANQKKRSEGRIDSVAKYYNKRSHSDVGRLVILVGVIALLFGLVTVAGDPGVASYLAW